MDINGNIVSSHTGFGCVDIDADWCFSWASAHIVLFYDPVSDWNMCKPHQRVLLRVHITPVGKRQLFQIDKLRRCESTNHPFLDMPVDVIPHSNLSFIHYCLLE